jgi:hypothetical protein
MNAQIEAIEIRQVRRIAGTARQLLTLRSGPRREMTSLMAEPVSRIAGTARQLVIFPSPLTGEGQGRG